MRRIAAPLVPVADAAEEDVIQGWQGEAGAGGEPAVGLAGVDAIAGDRRDGLDGAPAAAPGDAGEEPREH